MLRRSIIFFLLASLLSPIISFAESSKNLAGFVPGSLWYVNKDVKVGNTIPIFVALFNNEGTTISGKVDFFVDEKVIGTKDFSLSPNQVSGVSVGWNVTEGSHTLSAKIYKTKKHNESGVTEETVLSFEQSLSEKLTVEKSLNEKLGEKRNLIAGNITDRIVEKTPGVVNDTILAVDNVRKDFAEKIQNKKDSLEKEIKNSEMVVEKKSDSNLTAGGKKSNTKEAVKKESLGETHKDDSFSKNLQLASVIAADFVFKNPFFFYFSLFLILFLAIRFFVSYMRRDGPRRYRLDSGAD
jgi:hypothetical protein